VKTEEIKKVLKSRYGKAAEATDAKASCCCPSAAISGSSFATEHGLYGQEELSLVPEIARNLSRGCGNPTGFANLQSDEVVVDLGCGAGIDAILAARRVGPGGKVFGVDFAPQMIERAEQAVAETGLTDAVKLVVGDMEQLNSPDSFADVVISNCVINLSPEKDAVYREAFRILKPAGRLAICDIVLTERIEPHVQARLQSTWSGCLGGAIDEESYFDIIRKVGFSQPEIVARHVLASQELDNMACCPGPEFTLAPASEDLSAVQGKVVSIKFTAVKPQVS
jgi:SAM-dependent methyltransferase